MSFASSCMDALSHLFFPHVCAGCSSDHVDSVQMVCTNCLSSLPYTGFQHINNNAIEKIFWGRTPIQKAFSIFYYIPDSPLQRIVHQIKYNNASSLGIYMGSLMGEAMKDFFSHHPIELILPMPLHLKKEYARGYNQASLLCTGIAAVVTTQFRDDVLYRLKNTATQTKKSRIERWENVAEVFQIKDASLVHSKHILLVDDVITTGASAEACANLLLKNKAASVSICSLAYTI